MKYSELEPRAQDRARDAWREAGQDDEWWDCVYEDAIIVGKLMGIEIGTSTVRTTTGRSYERPDIHFSGFHHQGSYCAFSGTLYVAELAGAVEKVKTHVSNLDVEGGDKTLLGICQRAEAAHAGINAHWVANRLSDMPDDEWEAPECIPTMTVQIDSPSERTRVNDDDLSTDAADDLNALVTAFADWIYNQLEEEDDHLNSDEYIIEDINGAEPDFDEDGNLE